MVGETVLKLYHIDHIKNKDGKYVYYVFPYSIRNIINMFLKSWYWERGGYRRDIAGAFEFVKECSLFKSKMDRILNEMNSKEDKSDD